MTTDDGPRARKSKQAVFLQSNENNVESDLLYLKHAVINDQDPEIVMQKLKSTRYLRQTMCRQLETDYRENFPFFFTNPELVSKFTVNLSFKNLMFLFFLLILHSVLD